MSPLTGSTGVDELLEAARTIQARIDRPRRRQSRKACGAIKDRVWKRAQGQCEHCGTREGLKVHHVIARCKGGRAAMNNLKLYCSICERVDHRKSRLS